jgi:hypothetical protein
MILSQFYLRFTLITYTHKMHTNVIRPSHVLFSPWLFSKRFSNDNPESCIHFFPPFSGYCLAIISWVVPMKNQPISEVLLKKFRNVHFLRWRIFISTFNPKHEVPPLVGWAWLLIYYIRGSHPQLETCGNITTINVSLSAFLSENRSETDTYTHIN